MNNSETVPLSPREIILVHMKKIGPITRWEAFMKYELERFDSIMDELLELGYKLKKEWVLGVDKCNCFAYSLIDE